MVLKWAKNLQSLEPAYNTCNSINLDSSFCLGKKNPHNLGELQ